MGARIEISVPFECYELRIEGYTIIWNIEGLVNYSIITEKSWFALMI